MDPVASYDPRPVGQNRQESVKQVHIGQKWSQVGAVSLEPFVNPPEELPAYQGLFWTEGAEGVDLRPHYYDSASKQFLLVDSGSQVTAFPPDPGDKCDPNLHLKVVNGSKSVSVTGIKTSRSALGARPTPSR